MRVITRRVITSRQEKMSLAPMENPTRRTGRWWCGASATEATRRCARRSPALSALSWAMLQLLSMIFVARRMLEGTAMATTSLNDARRS